MRQSRLSLLPRQESWSRRTALQSRPDGSGDPSYLTIFLAGVIRLGMVATLVFLALGCDRGPERLAPVHGKVSCRGVPLRSGVIVFTPDPLRGSHGPLARAEIQRDGTYVLRSADALGAVIGWHRVTVAAVEVPSITGTGRRFVLPRPLIAEKYRDPELSGLACEVHVGRDNSIDWDLE
jgi:hypothetical protein